MTAGLDLFCDGDLDPGMRETEGDETLVLALPRRVDTRRGGLLDDPDYGLPLVDMLSMAQTRAGLDAIPAVLAAEFEKDERVVPGSVRAQSVRWDGKVLTVQLSGRNARGPFELVLAIDKVGAKLLPEGGA